jgi:DNA-binding NarL/FixJ family response regulator
MEIQEALKIMKALADGVNPETGEILPGDLIYQNPQNVRALHRAVCALEYVEDRERNKRLLPRNAGKPWSTQEEAQVCDELRSGTDFQQIARTHNRSVASIVARLVRLGKVSPKASPTRAA